MLLRTGRLVEARRKLEVLAEEESREPVQTPRAHRETQLLLSIIYAMQGRPEEAYQTALDGTRRGEELRFPLCDRGRVYAPRTCHLAAGGW